MRILVAQGQHLVKSALHTGSRNVPVLWTPFKTESILRGSCKLAKLGSCRAFNASRVTATMYTPPFSKQEQEAPGSQHQMDPKPSSKSHHYRPAGKLMGKTALITGGDSGIGRAVAHLFALEGASVAITYLHEHKDAEETKQLIKEGNKFAEEHREAVHKLVLRKGEHNGEHKGGEHHNGGGHHKDGKLFLEPLAIAMDLGKEENCKKVYEQVTEHFGGPVDILVNNCAEQHTRQGLEEVTSEEWLHTFETNIHSFFYLSKLCLSHMKEGSSIINTLSINAYKGNASLIAYTTTKGAILAFTRSLAQNVIGRGIRVNGVAPGPIWTPLIPSTMPTEKVEKFGQQTPMGRPGQPDEVATAYVFLASDDGTYYSGQVLHPNGGVVVNA